MKKKRLHNIPNLKQAGKGRSFHLLLKAGEGGTLQRWELKHETCKLLPRQLLWSLKRITYRCHSHCIFYSDSWDAKATHVRTVALQLPLWAAGPISPRATHPCQGWVTLCIFKNSFKTLSTSCRDVPGSRLCEHFDPSLGLEQKIFS